MHKCKARPIHNFVINLNYTGKKVNKRQSCFFSFVFIFFSYDVANLPVKTFNKLLRSTGPKLINVAILHCVQVRCFKERHVLTIMNNHDSHLSNEAIDYCDDNGTLPRCVQSSTPLNRSQAREKEEGWRQDRHPAVKEISSKTPMHEESKHGMNVSGKT